MRYEEVQATRILALAKRGFIHPRKQLRQTLGGKEEEMRKKISACLVAEALSPLARPEVLAIKAWNALLEHQK